MKIRDDQIAQLLGHPVRDDERLDELANGVGRVRLLKLDDGLDRLEVDKIADTSWRVLAYALCPSGPSRDDEGLDLLELR